MSEAGKQEPYCIIADDGRGNLPVYHVYSVPVEAQANAPVHPIYENSPQPGKHSPGSNTSWKHNSGRGDGRSVVTCEEKLGRTRGMTTCASCRQRVMTDITYKVGRFAKLTCVFFALFGVLLCVIPMLLLLIPLYVKDFKDVHHTCPLCYRELHIEEKRCCDCRTGSQKGTRANAT